MDTRDSGASGRSHLTSLHDVLADKELSFSRQYSKHRLRPSYHQDVPAIPTSNHRYRFVLRRRIREPCYCNMKQFHHVLRSTRLGAWSSRDFLRAVHFSPLFFSPPPYPLCHVRSPSTRKFFHARPYVAEKQNERRSFLPFHLLEF